MATFVDLGYADLAVDPTAVAFDPLYERLWVANAKGALGSYNFPDLSLYSAVQGHEGGIDALECCFEGVMSISSAGLRVHDRGGLLLRYVPRSALVGPSGGDVRTFCAVEPGPILPGDGGMTGACCSVRRVLVGGRGMNRVPVLDLTRAYTVRQGLDAEGRSRSSAAAAERGAVARAKAGGPTPVTSFLLVPHDVDVLSAQPGAVYAVGACGRTGKLSVLDPRARAASATMSLQPGGVSACAVSGHNVAVVGNHPGGIADPMPRVIDLRTLRALPPVGVPLPWSGPAAALCATTTGAIAFSATGKWEELNLGSGGVPAGGGSLASSYGAGVRLRAVDAAVAPTGNAAAVAGRVVCGGGREVGVVHLLRSAGSDGRSVHGPLLDGEVDREGRERVEFATGSFVDGPPSAVAWWPEKLEDRSVVWRATDALNPALLLATERRVVAGRGGVEVDVASLRTPHARALHPRSLCLSRRPPRSLAYLSLDPRDASAARNAVFDFAAAGNHTDPTAVVTRALRQAGLHWMVVAPEDEGVPAWERDEDGYPSVPRAFRPPAPVPGIMEARGALGSEREAVNPTPHAGIEGGPPGSPFLALFRALLCFGPLRAALGRHLSSSPRCVATELRLVADLVDDAAREDAAVPVPAAQMLRCIMGMPEARAVAVSPPVVAASRAAALLVRKLETDFLYGGAADAVGTPVSEAGKAYVAAYSHKGESSSATKPSTASSTEVPRTAALSLSAGFVETTAAAGTAKEVTHSSTPVVSVEPDADALFLPALAAALGSERRTRGWSAELGKYVPHVMRRRPSSLPALLMVESGITRTDVLEQWRSDDGWVPLALEIESRATDNDVRLRPLKMDAESWRDRALPPNSLRRRYALVGVLSFVALDGDPTKAWAADPAAHRAHGHFVATLLVHRSSGLFPFPAKSDAAADVREAVAEADWLTFSNGRVSRTSLADLRDENLVPSLFLWAAVHTDPGEDAAPLLRATAAATQAVQAVDSRPGAAAAARRELSLVPPLVFAWSSSVNPADSSSDMTLPDLPGPGDAVAIDAEFVMVASPRTRLRPDGSRAVVAAASLAPARVSAVRSDGSALLDDFIQPAEPVLDYLTRFSGLRAQDFDPTTTTHRLVSARSVLLKLRALVDSGIVLVGHGLSADFAALGLRPLPDKVKDTVDLFRLPGQRALALRFLAAHVLGQRVQEGAHDSLEDARTALLLYKAYLAIEKAGNVTPAVRKLYALGHSTDWTVASATDTQPLLEEFS